MVFYNHKGKMLNYDSFGIENIFKEIQKFIKNSKKFLFWNKNNEQSNLSMKKRLAEFRSMLSHKNFKKNDRFMITSIALKFLTMNCSKSDFNYLY